ncbi:uncharacterized protein LOC135091518 isoform X2 [Scylla paramamosain]|uniref:uncharacterized protein LOC135091518 isoform X2 n=1 Tax=Scylla paramamosain TaxID=85552 RepID=UPI003082F690
MIYVFPIDTGTLMTFDMNLALESVEVVKGTTDNAVKVLPDKQAGQQWWPAWRTLWQPSEQDMTHSSKTLWSISVTRWRRLPRFSYSTDRLGDTQHQCHCKGSETQEEEEEHSRDISQPAVHSE